MNCKGFKVLSLFSVVFFAMLSQAQTFTLNQAVQEAYQSSPEIQRAKADYDEQSWKTVEARSAFMPNLYGSVSYIANKKYAYVDIPFAGVNASIPQIVPTTQYTLSSRWNLFDGFASTYKYYSGKENEEASRLGYEWTKFQTERNVLLAYYKLLAAEQLQTVADQNVKALKDHTKDIEALKSAGVSTRYDVLRTEVQESEAEAELENTTDGVQSARNILAQVLGEDTELREATGALPVMTADVLKKGNFSTNGKLDLQSLEKKTEALHDNYEAMNKFWFPKLSLFADYSSYNNLNERFNDSKAFRDSYLIGATVTWSFFDGFGTVAESHQAEAKAIQLEKTLRIAQLKSKNDLDFWKRKYNYYISLYKSKTNDIDRSTEAVRLAKVGRSAGVRTNTDLLDAQADLFRSRAAQINAQIGAIEALVNIELATGEKLYSFASDKE